MTALGPRRASRARAREAYRLRCQHRTWDDIAAACGYGSAAAACKAVTRHIDRMPREETAMARALSAGTYRMVINELHQIAESAQAQNKHTPALQALQAIADVQERHDKLIGIQPVEANSTEVVVNITAAEALGQLRSQLSRVIDAEIVDAPVLELRA